MYGAASGFRQEAEHEILGTATIADAIRKMIVKAGLHSIGLLVAALELQTQPHLWRPFVICNVLAFAAQFIVFFFLVKVGRAREESIKTWNKMVSSRGHASANTGIKRKIEQEMLRGY
jgi:hypothetical protein